MGGSACVHPDRGSPTPPTLAVELAAEIEALSRLDQPGLRVAIGASSCAARLPSTSAAPRLRLLAYKLQARAYGDLDRDRRATSSGLRGERVRPTTGQGGQPKAPPPVIPPVPASRSLKVGTLLWEIEDGARFSWRAISRTPCRCARQIAISSRSANDR